MESVSKRNGTSSLSTHVKKLRPSPGHPHLKSYDAPKWNYFHVKTVGFTFGKDGKKGEAWGLLSRTLLKNCGEHDLLKISGASNEGYFDIMVKFDFRNRASGERDPARIGFKVKPHLFNMKTVPLCNAMAFQGGLPQ